MAFLQVKSTNPKFSFILKKNPLNPLVRHLKQGHLIGYYSNDNSVFNCYFKDADYENSYKFSKYADSSFEYLNVYRYNACEFVLDTITEFLSHIVKKQDAEDVEGYDNEVFLNLVYVKQKYLEIFSKYYSGYEIEYEKIAEGNFRVRFKTKKTLKQLIAFVQLFAIFNVLKNRFLNDGEIDKYIGIMDSAVTPYFIKYVFKVNVLNNEGLFNRYKAKLSENCVEDVDFTYGYLYQNRFDFVRNALDFKRDIVDFGCGEGNYIYKFRDKIDEIRYYAVDKDEDLREKVARRFGNKENLAILEVFPEISQPVDVIMSEVVEHMPLEEAEFTVKNIIANPLVNSTILTTPNKDFNQFYFFEDDEARHDDHHFEFTYNEFREWLEKVTENKYDFTIYGIGDKVNGCNPSLGATIRRKS
jgi:hypothetical protein